ncbi:MAG: hypothetical protein M3N31_04075 [Actinomycetota bacterium]|nr:hypothetical protein [Actinomycetota bacterium]
MRARLSLLLLLNMAVLAVLAQRSARPFFGAFVSAVAFWGLLVLFPTKGVNRRLVISPRNYFLFFFFMSMVVGPALMLTQKLLPRLWTLTYATWDTTKIFSYTLMSSLLWSLAFLCYLLAQRPTDGPHAGEGRSQRTGEPPADWMLVAGVALVASGVIGLVLTTGSVGTALSLGGRRSASESVLLSGVYRYVVWMEAAPVGAALVWYYITRRARLGRVGSGLLMLALYVPLVPFYLFSSGRTRALVPLLLLLALYHRFSFRFSTIWLVVGLVVLLPTLGAWSLHRRGVEDVSLAKVSATEVAAGDFSRYDVSVASVAGFTEGRMGHYLGRTFLTAATTWLPGAGSEDSPDGTSAMAQAIVGDREWRVASSYATPLVTESYLNFGFAGVAIIFLLFGRAVRWVDRLAESPSLLTSLFGLALALKLPFATSVDISVSQMVWAVGFPFAVAFLARSLLKSNAPVQGAAVRAARAPTAA